MKIPAIAYVSAALYTIPAIAGILRFRRLNNAMKVFLLLSLFSCVEISIEYVLGRNHINNASLSNDSYPIESAFICAVYILSAGRKTIKQIISMLALLYFAIWIVNKIYFDIPDQSNDQMAMASGIFIIIISVITIQTTVSKMNHPLIDEPIFWVSSGTLIYWTGVLFILGSSNELLKMGTSYFQKAWYVNWSLTIVANAMFTKAYLCRPKNQPSQSTLLTR